MANKTKNDLAWEEIFKEYIVLERIQKTGFFEIAADKLKRYREPRLMASIDHEANKPQVFKDYGLSILPNTRSSYIIGKFNTHTKVDYANIKPVLKKFPSNLTTINPEDLYSESAAIHCSFNSGIINDLFNGEQFFHTISGKMSSGEFSFSIANSQTNSVQDINIKNHICEIDAGFESERKIVLLEAKNMTVKDFVIRQLYFPYRLWTSKKTSKEVIPVFMTHSNDVFTFFIYKFNELKNYNSLELICQKNFAFKSPEIRAEDIEQIFSTVTVKKEPVDIPFPQADSFTRVLDLLGLLYESPISKDEITTYYDFDIRQTNYYTDAARYLGLVDKYIDEKNKEMMFSLTSSAKDIMSLEHKYKTLKLINTILEYPIFCDAYKAFKLNKNKLDTAEIIPIVLKYRAELNLNTAERRAQTIKQWISWVLLQTNS